MGYRNSQKAFTLMEVLIVVIIISIIAGFGMTNYYKSQERGYFKNASAQLRMIERAQELYFVRYDRYYPPDGDGDESNLSDLNADLKVNIMATGFTYECQDTNDNVTFSCTATREGGAYTVTVTDAAPDPVCTDGVKSCP